MIRLIVALLCALIWTAAIWLAPGVTLAAGCLLAIWLIYEFTRAV